MSEWVNSITTSTHRPLPVRLRIKPRHFLTSCKPKDNFILTNISHPSSTSQISPAAFKGQRVGYKRVSSADQNPARQLEGVQVDREFVDYASGRDTKRPQLKVLLQYARDGDTVVVHSMDRFSTQPGRSTAAGAGADASRSAHRVHPGGPLLHWRGLASVSPAPVGNGRLCRI